MKTFLSKLLFNLGDLYSKLPEWLMWYSVYDWFMCKSYLLDEHEQVWTSKDEEGEL